MSVKKISLEEFKKHNVSGNLKNLEKGNDILDVLYIFKNEEDHRFISLLVKRYVYADITPDPDYTKENWRESLVEKIEKVTEEYGEDEVKVVENEEGQPMEIYRKKGYRLRVFLMSNITGEGYVPDSTRQVSNKEEGKMTARAIAKNPYSNSEKLAEIEREGGKHMREAVEQQEADFSRQNIHSKD